MSNQILLPNTGHCYHHGPSKSSTEESLYRYYGLSRLERDKAAHFVRRGLFHASTLHDDETCMTYDGLTVTMTPTPSMLENEPNKHS